MRQNRIPNVPSATAHIVCLLDRHKEKEDAMTTASAHRSIRLCALLILICAAALLLPWGRPALGAETDGSPCMLTDEQRAAYEADGTLEARIAYQESLRNDRPSEGLISQAMERERAAKASAHTRFPQTGQAAWPPLAPHTCSG